MKEYGVGTSWSKLFTVPERRIPVSPWWLTVICSWNGKVFFQCNCREMVLYDMKKKTWKALHISIRSGIEISSSVHVESIISPFPSETVIGSNAFK